MTRRDYVKAAIQHRADTPHPCADRVPYAIDLCPDAWEAVKKVVGDTSPEAFLDNDVRDFSAPWWKDGFDFIRLP